MISSALGDTEIERAQVARLRRAAAAGLRPDPILTVSEWAERHRVLSSESSPEPGRWRNSRTPYLVEVMDALSTYSPVRSVALMFGAQLGKTECVNNWTGYVIDAAPGPMLSVLPRVEDARKISQQRVAPLIRSSPRLRAKVRDPRSRDSGNTTFSKTFPGGIFMLTGANSAPGLRSMPIRYLAMDELDAYPDDVDGEGDPIKLAEARTSNFRNAKLLKVSTPTVAGASKIEEEFDDGDQRRYFVPCPECGHEQHLVWANLRFDTRTDARGRERVVPDSVGYACESCAVLIREQAKPAMLAAGRWVPMNPDARPGRRSYHLSSLYSPWFRWLDLAEEWVEAKRDTEKLKTFVNTRLGETWQEKGEAPGWEQLYHRREDYRIGTVPEGVVVVTCGVDVQRDRLEAEVVGWGRDLESWSIDYVVLEGDPAEDAVWGELDALLERTFPGAHGIEHRIARMAVDSSFSTTDVYGWVRKHEQRRVMAIKGRDELPVLVGHPQPIDVSDKGKKIRRGVKLWGVGTTVAKRELYGWLRRPKPTDAEQPLPIGWCHFPQYPEHWFKMLTAEEQRKKTVRGYSRWEWVKIRERNEALDCRVYARFAAAVVGIDRWTDEEWDEREAALGLRRPTEPPKAAASAQRSERRAPGEGWLDRWRTR